MGDLGEQMRSRVPNAKATRPMRVLMLDLWATVPYYTAYLSRALKRAGVQVQAASITYYLDRATLQRCGLRPQPGLLDLVGKLDLPRSPRRVLKLAEGLLNLLALSARVLLRPPAILHVQFLPLLLSRLPLDRWFVLLCQRRGVPLVLTVHDLLPHDTGEAHRVTYARLYGQADALICHSAHIEERLTAEFGVSPDRIAVIPHGPFFFDIPVPEAGTIRNRLGVAPGQAMILWQGIIFPYKGVDLLLNAWQRLEQGATPDAAVPDPAGRDTADQACLVIMGTGEAGLTASLTAQAQRLGLRNVRFHLSFCSPEDLVAAYRAAAAVVYPYRAITTSGALATGLSLGKAIVASRLPVFEEVLTEGETAMFANPDNPEELATAIHKIVREPALRSHLETNVQAMNFSERTWEEIAQRTEAVYQSVIAGRD